jgi:Ca2+-binding RTX toxin-like protein
VNALSVAGSHWAPGGSISAFFSAKGRHFDSFFPESNPGSRFGLLEAFAPPKPEAVQVSAAAGQGEFARQATVVLSDPLLPSQWHNSPTSAVNINIVEAWTYFSGRGVKFGVYDDGIDITHPDLAANYDASRHVTVAGTVFPNPTVYNAGDAHGTAVAGLIAAVGGNSQGGVGGSFNGRLTGVDIFSSAGNTYIFGAMNEQDRFDVTNHSWGWVTPFADNSLSTAWSSFFGGLQDAAVNGRGGLGTIQMVAGGNDRTTSTTFDNTNTSNFTSSRFVNAIAAIASNGQVSFYSNPGASLLVSAPSSGSTGTLGIITTDYTGTGRGYSTASDYTTTFGGTSAATPIASGVVGLMLEANPFLGYRDVMEILAITARQIGDPAAAGAGASLRPWQFNGATNWNNGGMHFSHDYGFGLIDAFAAVKLADSWNLQQTIANEILVSASNTTAGAVPDHNPTAPTSFERSVTLTSATPLTIEAIEVQITWSVAHASARDLVIELISPSGMISYLHDRSGGAAMPGSWVFTTRAHLGEMATGDWTVRISDASAGFTGTISGITLRAYGSAEGTDVNDNYYYTDEFGTVSTAATTRQSLADTDGGIDTINVAALSRGATINLNEGQSSSFAGSSFVIAQNTVIENVIGSWSNDIITGNVAANKILGNAGADTIFGNDGDDILFGNDGADTIDGGVGADHLYGGAGSDIVDGGDGLDTYFLEAAWAAVTWAVDQFTVTFTFFDQLLGVDIVSGVEFFTDSSGTALSWDQLVAQTPPAFPPADTSAPTLLSLLPADNATAVDPASNIVLTFNEAVLKGVGSISLRLASDGSEWRRIDVTSPEVTISGAQVTINPGVDLLAGTAFYVTIGAGALTDLAANPFAGITDTAAFNFATSARVITGGIGNDTLTGTAGGDIINGGAGNDVINGGAGNDVLNGEAGTDVINGGAGNDVIDGGAGTDTVTYAGETGNLVVSLAVTTAQANGAAGSDQLTNVENLIGGDGNDTLTGNGVANRLTGGAGNDTLNGGTGTDTLIGGLGDDTYITDGADTITELSAQGTDWVQSSATHTLAANVENLTLTGAGVINGTGNTLNNVITGNGSNNTLSGGAGNDTLTGGAGNDILNGGTGTDVLVGGLGSDTFVFNTISDSTTVSPTWDIITDFTQGQDRIDLRGIDAFGVGGTNAAFVWNGTSAFSSTTAGEARYQLFDAVGTADDYTVVFLDNDADTAVEMAIRLHGLHTLTAADFML